MKPTDQPDADNGAAGRRTFLKKVAIGGAAAWTAPIILSTTSIVAAASVAEAGCGGTVSFRNRGTVYDANSGTYNTTYSYIAVGANQCVNTQLGLITVQLVNPAAGVTVTQSPIVVTAPASECPGTHTLTGTIPCTCPSGATGSYSGTITSPNCPPPP